VNVLDALSCPYCAGLLLKESYYFRCDRDHRFTSSFDPAEPHPRTDGEERGSAEPTWRGRLVLRVISHPDRGEIGTIFAFPLGEGSR
jgi:hypothetical protein